MSTYLVAFVVSDFQYEMGPTTTPSTVSTTTLSPVSPDVPYKVWVRPGQENQVSNKQANAVWQAVSGILRF